MTFQDGLHSLSEKLITQVISILRWPQRLSAFFVKNVNVTGRYGDGRGGHGLSLIVKPMRNGGGTIAGDSMIGTTEALARLMNSQAATQPRVDDDLERKDHL